MSEKAGGFSGLNIHKTYHVKSLRTSKVDQLDDTCGHQHNIASFNVPGEKSDELHTQEHKRNTFIPLINRRTSQ